MLLEFGCENFRSFKGKVSLSMLPVNAYKEHPENVIVADIPGSNADGVLSVAVVYGTNASGKTNLLRAVNFAQCLVLGVMYPGHLARRENFVGNTDPTRFFFSFMESGQRFEYQFSYDDMGIVEEELKVRVKAERLVFRREKVEGGGYAVKQGSRYSGIASKLKNYSDNGLVLGMLSRYGIEVCERAMKWFSTGISVINREAPAEYGDILDKLAGLGQDSFEKVMRAVNAADLGISGAQLNVDDMTEEEQSAQRQAADKLGAIFEVLTGQKPDGFQIPEKKVALQFKHVIDGHGVGFGFDDESLGTVTMLDLAADFIGALDSGKVLFVDEAERSLHPLLLERLVALFSDKELNKKDAQLVFTTHDLSFLSSDLIRRDQIWFVQKEAGAGSSEVYPLSSFSPRKDESIMNRYLYGAYGAVPFIDERLC